MFRSQPRPPARLAHKIPKMPRATAVAAFCFACGIGSVLIEGELQLVEGGVGQQGWVQDRGSSIKVLTKMAKPGRNDPCHCGSGKKYKKCCQPKDDEAERQVIAQEQAAREQRTEARRAQLAEERELDEEFQELVTTSNAATDLVRAGRLEEAETLARDLLERFPHVHDGWDRLGMVHEARGENKQAADCYRKAIEIIRAEPEMYDPQFADVFVKLVDKLDPPGAAQTTE